MFNFLIITLMKTMLKFFIGGFLLLGMATGSQQAFAGLTSDPTAPRETVAASKIVAADCVNEGSCAVRIGWKTHTDARKLNNVLYKDGSVKTFQ